MSDNQNVPKLCSVLVGGVNQQENVEQDKRYLEG